MHLWWFNSDPFRNTSLALPGPQLDSSTVSAPVIGSSPRKLQSANQIELTPRGNNPAAGEAPPVVTKVVEKPLEEVVPVVEKSSSTFLTDLIDNQPGIIARYINHQFNSQQSN